MICTLIHSVFGILLFFVSLDKLVGTNLGLKFWDYISRDTDILITEGS